MSGIRSFALTFGQLPLGRIQRKVLAPGAEASEDFEGRS